jgi:glycosyltransferase involved in cell wall biosynthesis
LLKALDLLQKEGVHIELTLVGAIDKSYKKIIDEQGYAEAYNHIEHIPNKQMNTFMSKFDMLVLPSIEDGFGIVVAEALCSGIPVITTKAAGAADIITNHINGYKIPPHDIDSIANAIKISCNRTFRLDQPNVLTWEEYAERLTIIYQGLKND